MSIFFAIESFLTGGRFRAFRGEVVSALVWFVPFYLLGLTAVAQTAANSVPEKIAVGDLGELPPHDPVPAIPPSGVYIQEYRIEGSKRLPKIEVEEAVYPFMGPGRTPEDVEQARAALEKAYQEKGFQTVAVEIPQQQVRGGIVFLQVVEAPVGRLRVKGSRFYSLDEIKKRVPSLAEGNVPNFNEVAKEMVALNQLPDRRITPVLRAGIEPGTVDVDLNVKDAFPLHGSVELNNRYSANTTPLRLNASLSYNNLWQMGHTVGLSFQVAPQRPEDAIVYSGYYIARLPGVEWLSFMLQGTRQNSNVSTLGGGAVAGNGEVVGGRLMINLPPGKDFFHSVSLGLDYKHFSQDLVIGESYVGTPITYFPGSVNYNAAWVGKGYTTELNGSIVASLRGVGNDQYEFDNRRYNADGGFLYFRGDLAHTRELPLGFELYGQVQGQATGQPLVDSEQFSGGGLDTVRGYLESEVLGDNALIGSIELRSPSLPNILGVEEWRVFAFTEGGILTINDPLPEQESEFRLASIGAGTRIRIFKHFNGSLDAGVPLISQALSPAGSVLMTFRIWGDF